MFWHNVILPTLGFVYCALRGSGWEVVGCELWVVGGMGMMGVEVEVVSGIFVRYPVRSAFVRL